MAVTQIAIFLISAAALALELVLVRALAIGHWHHFSFLVISTALLGFGAGATFVTIAAKPLTTHYGKTLWGFALGLALSVPIVWCTAQKVPFDELQLIWDRLQIVYLFAYYLLLSIPFFCTGVCVALAFTVAGDKAHRLYFYNMTGSGLAVAVIIALMYGNCPGRLLMVVSGIGFLAALVSALAISRRWLAGTLICAVVWFLIFGFNPWAAKAIEIEISENKSLVYYNALPGAETIATEYSPLARLDCLKAPAVRYFPGLGIGYQGRLTPQILIISDADGISAVNSFDGPNDLAWYDWTTSALAYHLQSRPDVCIIGAGGGCDVAGALALNARTVTAVEMNPQVIDLVRNRFDEFTGGLYRLDDVQIIISEGRNFLQTASRQFDIINISLLESLGASAAGLYSLNESGLYTVQAVEQAFEKLRPGGLLSITRLLKTPPRDSLKMLATVTEALRRRGVTKPAAHIIMLRSWATATIVASPQPISELQIANARQFSVQRGCDLVHLPDIAREEVNRFHILEEPIYYDSAQWILSDHRDNFYDNYSYNVRPATDDRPYFWDFFKWKALPRMMRTIPGQWLVFTEWGYLVLAATLLQALCASALFILLPLWLAKPVKTIKTGKLATFAYFILLGLAFMFLEMGFIQKMTLLIGHPVFGVAVVLTGFLVFSGCGSLAAGRISQAIKCCQSATALIWIAVLAIIVIGAAEIAVMKLAFEYLVGFSRMGRILLGLGITAPLAFFMGIPLPSAVKCLHAHSRPLVPWAWGVNGFASVTGAVLGTLLAVSVGFTTLMLIALACYFSAAVISKRVCT